SAPNARRGAEGGPPHISTSGRAILWRPGEDRHRHAPIVDDALLTGIGRRVPRAEVGGVAPRPDDAVHRAARNAAAVRRDLRAEIRSTGCEQARDSVRALAWSSSEGAAAICTAPLLGGSRTRMAAHPFISLVERGGRLAARGYRKGCSRRVSADAAAAPTSAQLQR